MQSRVYGRSTGPHLDWRMEINGTRIDPQLLIKIKIIIHTNLLPSSIIQASFLADL